MDEYLRPYVMNYSRQSCSINIPADVLEKCDPKFDLRTCSHSSLLHSILAIRAYGGKYKRAGKTLEDIGIPVPIVVYVVKKICKILGCSNLDTSISPDDAIKAFETFLMSQQHHYDGYGGQGSNSHWSPQVKPPSEYDDANVNMPSPNKPGSIITHSNSFNQYQGPGTNTSRSSYYMDSPVTSPHGLNQSSNSFSQQYEPSGFKPQGEISRMDSFRGDESQYPPSFIGGFYNGPNNYPINEQPDYPSLGDFIPSNIFIPDRPADIHIHILQLLLPEVNVDLLLQRDPPYGNQTPNQRGNNGTRPRQSSIAYQPDLQSICHLFWILSICVFITVCDDRQSINESLVRLFELCQFVGSGNPDLLTMSPVLGVALDVIMQRAIYELSDKITLSMNSHTDADGNYDESSIDHDFKSHSQDRDDIIDPNNVNDVYSQSQVLYDIIHTDSAYAKDLYKCISLMIHSVSDSCTRIESAFLPGHNFLSSPMGGPESEPNMYPNSPSLSRTNSKYSNNDMSSSYAYPGSTQTTMNSRTQKLAKQLRETLAWSSCKDQLPVESFTALARFLQTTNATANTGNTSNIVTDSGSQTDNSTQDNTNIFSKGTIDIHELYASKCKSADSALVQIAGAYRSSDAIYHEIDQTRMRLSSLFLSTVDSTDFSDSIIDLGGLSGSSLLPHLHSAQVNQTLQSQSKQSSTNANNLNNLNNFRSNTLLNQSPQGGYGTAFGDIEFVLNVPSFNSRIQSFRDQITALQNKLNICNDILRIDTTIENCLKHIKACIKEARIQMTTYCNDLQAYSQVYAKKYYVNQASPSQGYPYGGRGPNQSRRGQDNASMDITAKIARIRAEMETLCSTGDRLISVMGNNLRSLRSNGVISATVMANMTPSNMSSGFRNINGQLHIDSNYIVSNDFDTLSRLPSLLQTRRFITDEITKLTNFELNEVKRYLKAMEQLLRDNNYPSVKLIGRDKHPGIKYGPFGNRSTDGSMSLSGASLTRTITPPVVGNAMPYSGGPLIRSNTPPVSANITASQLSRTLSPMSLGGQYAGMSLSRTVTPSPLSYYLTINDSGMIDPYHQLSSFYNMYCNFDKSNKIKYYLSCVIHFARIHTLCDPDNGTLSIEGWLVIAIHVLLHFRIVPNLHEEHRSSSNHPMGGLPIQDHAVSSFDNMSIVAVSVEGTSSTSSSLTNSTANMIKSSRLDEYSLIGLLELFFRYLTEDFDILGSIITVRGKGEQLPKNQWKVDPPVMWRLCIEDPFEKSLPNCTKPYDLGATLTRPGQIQLFKALRRAAFGVNAIVMKDIADTEKFVRMLFHKDDLLALSRLSGYNGAAVINTPLYTPNYRKLKVIYSWTIDCSSFFLGNDPSHNTRNVVGSRQNSGNSLLDELATDPMANNVRRGINSDNNTSFSTRGPSPAFSSDLRPSAIEILNGDDTIKIIDGDYSDSDSDDEGKGNQNYSKISSSRNQVMNRSQNSIIERGNSFGQGIGQQTGNLRREGNVGGSSSHNLSNSSLNYLMSDQQLPSPPRRPPVAPSPGSMMRSMGETVAYNRHYDVNNVPGPMNLSNTNTMQQYPVDRQLMGRRSSGLSRDDMTGGIYHPPYPSPAQREGTAGYSYNDNIPQDMNYQHRPYQSGYSHDNNPYADSPMDRLPHYPSPNSSRGLTPNTSISSMSNSRSNPPIQTSIQFNSNRHLNAGMSLAQVSRTNRQDIPYEDMNSPNRYLPSPKGISLPSPNSSNMNTHSGYLPGSSLVHSNDMRRHTYSNDYASESLSGSRGPPVHRGGYVNSQGEFIPGSSNFSYNYGNELPHQSNREANIPEYPSIHRNDGPLQRTGSFRDGSNQSTSNMDSYSSNMNRDYYYPNAQEQLGMNFNNSTSNVSYTAKNSPMNYLEQDSRLLGPSSGNSATNYRYNTSKGSGQMLSSPTYSDSYHNLPYSDRNSPIIGMNQSTGSMPMNRIDEEKRNYDRMLDRFGSDSLSLNPPTQGSRPLQSPRQLQGQSLELQQGDHSSYYPTNDMSLTGKGSMMATNMFPSNINKISTEPARDVKNITTNLQLDNIQSFFQFDDQTAVPQPSINSIYSPNITNSVHSQSNPRAAVSPFPHITLGLGTPLVAGDTNLTQGYTSLSESQYHLNTSPPLTNRSNEQTNVETANDSHDSLNNWLNNAVGSMLPQSFIGDDRNLYE